MKTYLAFFLASLVLVLLITPATRNLGIRLGILDRPNLRKIHQTEIPCLGGLAVLISTVLPFIGFLFYSNLLLEQIRNYWQPLLGLSLGALIVFTVGLVDDMVRLKPWPKLGIECLAGLIAILFGLRIEFFAQTIGLQGNLHYLSYPLTILWLVGVTNAVNLADGLDGLATGIAAFAALILFCMTYNTAHTVVALLAIALAGATVGFLRYNFYPATIFLGDSGSLFMGFYLGGLSIWASEKSTITFALLIPGVALGLPLADMAYAVLRRWQRGVSIKQADREHIHHKLLDMGFAQRATVLILYGVNILLVSLAALLLVTRNSLAAYILVFLGLALFIGSRILGYFQFSRFMRTLRQRWKDLQRTKYIAFRSHLLRQAFQREKTLSGRWQLAQELFRELGCRQARFISADSRPSLPDWSLSDPENLSTEKDHERTLEISLQGENGLLGSLWLSWAPEADPFPTGLNKFLTVMAYEFGRNLAGTE
jgi:UDP-GlcNAc:undecaprenyl-phosphate/decaprenyl-phosphate GlcNAc-1-phosphate transferase